jgi:purine-binding chemotaxis protein CheW
VIGGGANNLFLRAGTWTCALPVGCVVEVMRPLPCRPCAGVPGYVRGASVIRGCPTPVVDLAAFLGCVARDEAGRFVLTRAGSHDVALHVDEVLGWRRLAHEQAHALPGLLSGLASEQVDSLRTLDGQLVASLERGVVLSEDVLHTLGLSGATP